MSQAKREKDKADLKKQKSAFPFETLAYLFGLLTLNSVQQRRRSKEIGRQAEEGAEGGEKGLDIRCNTQVCIRQERFQCHGKREGKRLRERSGDVNWRCEYTLSKVRVSRVKTSRDIYIYDMRREVR